MRPRALGPYRIERRLATGGMAEVYVASRLGPHGFQKRLALKCILPQHARDPDFVGMFIDEARLAALLEHPGVVSVFDFGEADGTLFLAMEYVDGSNVNRLLRALAVQGDAVPLPISLHVAAEAARALAYAHNAVDAEGRALSVVHRDVSPANLLLTRRGHVKLSDFGIARCVQSDHRTDDGHVRGKLGYMSPEQVSGFAVDAKSDVFTLGTVLAEMLIGEPLFGGGTDLEVLLRIRRGDLSVLDASQRAIPADVRRLLGAALARKPTDRPEAGALAEALEHILRRRAPTASPQRQLARLLARLELVVAQPGDAAAHEPGARPTSLVEAEELARRDPGTAARTAATRELLGKLVLDPPQSYDVELADGHSVGPIPYHELVRRIVLGEVDESSVVRREGEAARGPRDIPELQRYLRSRALRWDTDEIVGADSRGEIAPGVLLRRIHQISLARETGVLHVWDAKRRKKVYFVEGKPDFVGSTERKELLGEHLVARGDCLRMEVDMALALLPRYDGRLGDALVGMGVLRPNELFRAVADQVRERYLEIFRWREGRWAFRRGVVCEEETYPMGQSAHELLRDAALRADPAEMEAALSTMRERVVVTSSRPPIALREFGMPDQWVQLLAEARGDSTLGGILARATRRGADPEEVYRAFYLGLSCDLVSAA